MGIKNKLFTVTRSLKSPPTDNIITVNDLVGGPAGETIVLPMLPTSGTGTKGIDFAAANILERVVIGSLIRHEKPIKIFEIGTFRGVTALTMVLNAPPEATLYTLDLPQELSPDKVAKDYYSESSENGFIKMAREGSERMVGVAFSSYNGPCHVKQLFGDSNKFNFLEYAPVDVFFVDGCHFYSSARSDTQSAWKSLRQGGLILWHDYNMKSVYDAVRDCNLGCQITWVAGTSIAFARKL